VNEWATRTAKLAQQTDYLDRLYEIYPGETYAREVDSDTSASIRRYLDEGDNASLLRCLLRLQKFPIKDSYVDFLRRFDRSIENNPATVARICGAIRSLGYEGIISWNFRPAGSE
jgi:hypothetical protein